MPTSVHLQPASEEEPLVEADSDILDIFLEEAEDLLESIEAAIGRMSGGAEDGEALDDLPGCCTPSRAVRGWPGRRSG